MADISAEIAAFQSAVYGEDVRTAMVNLANKVNNEGSAAATTVAEYDTRISAVEADGYVTNAKLADGSVTDAKLADGSVTDAKLAQSGGVLEEVNNLKSAIANIDAVETIMPVIISGQYFNGSTNQFQSSNNYSYSETFDLYKGDTVSVTCFGTTGIVGILNECDDTEYTNAKCVILANEDTVKTYVYDVPENGLYFVSFRSNNTYTCVIKKAIYQATQNARLTALEESTPVNTLVTTLPNVTNGAFVNASTRGITSGPTKYWYSDLVEINIGAIVTVDSADPSGDSVARISSWNEAGTELLEIIAKGTTTASIVTYEATGKQWIRFSGFAGYKFDITINDMDVPNGFKKAVEIANAESGNTNALTNISMFSDIAVCGDSYTAGAICDRNGSMGNLQVLGFCPYGDIVERITGVTVETYAVSGADTGSFQTNNDCLPKILNDSAHQLYIFALGINDYSKSVAPTNPVPLGTIDDIKSDYTQNPVSFYGNYGRILAQVIAHAPDAKIILSTVFIPTYGAGNYYNFSTDAIAEIADYFGVMFVDTNSIDYLRSNSYNATISANGGHPTAPLYGAIAKAVCDLVGANIGNNLAYYNDFIPIGI